jgi:uncharacterized repeat protein (TIGR03803 family)
MHGRPHKYESWARGWIWGIGAAALGCAAMAPGPSLAQPLPLTTILPFDEADGANPEAGLVVDAKGTLYGTTTSGARSGGGTVFKLTPSAKSATGWTLQVLHNFAGNSDGYDLLGPVAVFNSVVYGATFLGGSGKNGCYADGLGCGTIFKVALPTATKKGLTYTILHKFSAKESDNDGAMPVGGVIVDATGTLYGTTSQGGGTSCTVPGTGCGVFFSVSPGGSYNILYRFQGGSDANDPVSTLAPGPGGALYGASFFGGDTGSACVWGSFGCGVVFKLVPNASRTAWSETVLYRFSGGTDGSNPNASVVVDGTGAVYGTTSFGGTSKLGTVFRLANGSEQVIHNFAGGGDGSSPSSPLSIGAGGVLFGTTTAGGNADCLDGDGCGIAFALAPPAKGQKKWTETILHVFTGGADGGGSSSGLLLTGSGMFGTALFGGTSSDSNNTGAGSVFFLDAAAGSCGSCGLGPP